MNAQWPDIAHHLHLTTDEATLYIDTSGEPRCSSAAGAKDKGRRPLKGNPGRRHDRRQRGWEPATTPALYAPAAAAAHRSWSRPRRSPAASRRACCGDPFAFGCCLQAHVWSAIKNKLKAQYC